MIVKDKYGQSHTCLSPKKFKNVICGDYVHCKSSPTSAHQIIELLPRKNKLSRETEYATKVIAANIDLITIVCAIEPSPSLELIDQYIVAAENLSASAIIIINKVDLDNVKIIESINLKYKRLPYPIFETSVYDLSSLNHLAGGLKNKTCIFVGQSGVGKSTLTNKLIPAITIETQSISDNIQQGKHTTSVTRLYDLPQGGELIDSPGVRDFTQPKLNKEYIIKGFREIAELGNQCKYHDCIHIKEPDCAIKEALLNKKINKDRYESYVKMIEKCI